MGKDSHTLKNTDVHPWFPHFLIVRQRLCCSCYYFQLLILAILIMFFVLSKKILYFFVSYYNNHANNVNFLFICLFGLVLFALLYTSPVSTRIKYQHHPSHFPIHITVWLHYQCHNVGHFQKTSNTRLVWAFSYEYAKLQTHSLSGNLLFAICIMFMTFFLVFFSFFFLNLHLTRLIYLNNWVIK